MEEYSNVCFLRGSRFNKNHYRIFTLALREALIRYNYIDEEREDEWMCMFEGGSIREQDQFSFRWNQANSHCVYLFDKLEEEQIIVKEKLDNTINRFFGIKNVAQTRYSYYPKPKGSDVIIKLVKEVITHTLKF